MWFSHSLWAFSSMRNNIFLKPDSKILKELRNDVLCDNHSNCKLKFDFEENRPVVRPFENRKILSGPWSSVPSCHDSAFSFYWCNFLYYNSIGKMKSWVFILYISHLCLRLYYCSFFNKSTEILFTNCTKISFTEFTIKWCSKWNSFKI